jgi:hypothetical protein
MTYIPLKAGQIWGDCFNPSGHRYLVIEEVGEDQVKCRTLRTGKSSSIRRDRMTPGARGYFLALDPETVIQVLRQLTGTVQPLEPQSAQPIVSVETKTASVIAPPALPTETLPSGSPKTDLQLPTVAAESVERRLANQDKIEDRLYRVAKRIGFALEKCRSHDHSHADYGSYRILNRTTNEVIYSIRPESYGLTLAEAEQYLERAKAQSEQATIQQPP